MFARATQRLAKKAKLTAPSHITLHQPNITTAIKSRPQRSQAIIKPHSQQHAGQQHHHHHQFQSAFRATATAPTTPTTLAPSQSQHSPYIFSIRTIATAGGLVSGGALTSAGSLARTIASPFIPTSVRDIATTATSPAKTQIDLTSPLTNAHAYHFEPNHKFPTPFTHHHPEAAPLQSLPATISPKIEDKNHFPWGLSYEELPSDIKRVIVVGDIHGCYDELITLLESVDYDVHNDMLISLGDIVGKGPKQTQVIDFFYNLQRYVIEEIDGKQRPIDADWALTQKSAMAAIRKSIRDRAGDDELQDLENQQQQQQQQQQQPQTGAGVTHHKASTDSLFTNAMVPSINGLIPHFPKRSASKYSETLDQFGVNTRYADSGLKLHTNNSRVFVTMANHEKFLLGYLDYLHMNGLMPEEAPLKSSTHTQAARDLYVPSHHPTTLRPESPRTWPAGYQQYQTAISSLNPDELEQHNALRDELTRNYKSRHNSIEASTRLEWLRALPSFLFIPQLKIGCVHAGVPPDLCMLFPKPNPLRTNVETRDNGVGDASSIMCPIPYADSVDDYFTAGQLPRQTDYMSKLLGRITDFQSLLNVRSVIPSSSKSKSVTAANGSPEQYQKVEVKKLIPDQVNGTGNWRLDNRTARRQVLESALTQFELKPKLPSAKSTTALIQWSKAYSNRILNHKTNHPEDESGYPHMLFGHDAVSGLQLEPYATGLDTGCCYGGKLSGLVFHVDPTLKSEGFAPQVDRRKLKEQIKRRHRHNDDMKLISDVPEGEFPSTPAYPESVDDPSPETPTLVVRRNGLSDTDLPQLESGTYSSQQPKHVPMDLASTIHIKQPVLVQVKSKQPYQR